MRKLIAIAAVAAGFLSVLPGALAVSHHDKGSVDTLVIVFKDGHRQTFSLADIARVEFPGVQKTEAENPNWPAHGQFVGRWVVGDGNGDTFVITLKENGDAWRSLRDVHGHWAYIDGEARITWDDAAKDAIRKVDSKFQKYAYGAGKSFTDAPDNVTAATNTTPRPI